MKSGQIPEPFEYKERQRLREQTIYEEDRQQKNRWELLEQRMEGKNLDIQKPALKTEEKKVAEIWNAGRPKKNWEILRGKPVLHSEEDALFSGTLSEKTPAKEEPKTQNREDTSFEVQTEALAKQLDLFQERMLSQKARSRHRLIGQVFDTYWLVEYEDKFYIIDQHAAHEKVLYERTMKSLAKKCPAVSGKRNDLPVHQPAGCGESDHAAGDSTAGTYADVFEIWI